MSASGQAKAEERRRKEAEKVAKEQAERQLKEEEKKRKEAEKQAREQAERQKKEAEVKAGQDAELKRKQEEEGRKAEEESRRQAGIKAKEAERQAKEQAEIKRREEEQRKKRGEQARREAEQRAREQAELTRRQEEERRSAEEQAKREAERRTREEAEIKRRQEEAKLRAEEQAKKDAEKKAREEAELKRKQEEESRKSFERLEKARKEAERVAREQAAKKMREDEEKKREAERKAREEGDRKARELEDQKRREERLAREAAEQRQREEEERLREQQRLSKEQAERQRKVEEEKKRADEPARREAERRAREEAEKKAREIEEQKKKEEEERKKAEQLAKEEAERKRMEEEARVREQERLSREQAERQRKLEEERRRTEELARREAERKAREIEEQKRLAEEKTREEAETRMREEAEKKRRLEEEQRAAAEKVRKEAERVAREQAEKRRLEEEARLREQQRVAREEAEKKRRLEEERRKQEEQARREADYRARVEAERKRREEAEKKRTEELRRKEEERRTKEEEKRKSRELEEQRKAEERAKREVPPIPATVPPAQQQEAPGKPEAIRLPTTGKAPSAEEAKKRQREVIAALRKVKIRYPATGTPLPPVWRTLERYPVNSPFAFAVVAESPISARRYFLDEVPLTKIEAGIYSYLLDALEDELTVPRTEVNPRQYFADQARRILLKYSIRVPATSWAKILYYAERDLVGFGAIDGLMRDPNIEDISLDAVGRPIFIYHKGYENLETNIAMSDDDTLDSIVTRLSHMAGKHVSTAFPIVQGTLPGRHRLVATFRREVSPLGSSATIRKFREDPLTIIDMLNLKLLDPRLAAYAWLMMQNRATGIVVGATGAGKTTLLNALLTLTRLNTKVVTIEEVQEMNIPHQNWTSLVARESYAATEERAGAVDLFELVKAAMRMRPDILVVGEVRGEEAYVLFQALSTGHGGICTLHSDDTASALQRLISQPMNVPASFIPFLDLSFVIRRISVPLPDGGFRSTRRIISVDEVVREHEYQNIFKWEPRTDTYATPSLEKSGRLGKIAKDNGVRVSELIEEIERRTVVLRWLQKKGIRNFKEVSPILEIYASRPQETYDRALGELEAAGAVAPKVTGSEK